MIAAKHIERFNNWQRIMAALPLDGTARRDVFIRAADDIGSVVASNGLDGSEAAAKLVDIALAHSIGESDAVQRIIGEAFEKAKKANGHGAPFAEISITRPFPLIGSTIPRRPILVPGLLHRCQLTVLVAPPGSGKSLLMLQVGMICAAGGHPDWAWKPRQRYRVLIINSEEDADELRRRMFGARERMNFPEQYLAANLAFADTPESIVIAKADSKTKTVTRTPMLDRIITTIQMHKIDVVIVDPFAETFEGDENSNSELKWAAVLWREVARRTNAAILLIHHTRKYAHDMAGDPDAGRGAGALIGVARIVSTLFTMTEREAEDLKIRDQPVKERHRYVRYDDAKANLNLMSSKTRWFVKMTERVPNEGDGEPADEVGVLVPWQPPDPLAGLNEAVAKKILDVIDRGYVDDDGNETGDPFTLRRTGKSKRWAGFVIQRFIGCDVDAAKDLLDKWISNKFLEEFETTVGRKEGVLGLKVIGRPGIIEEDTMELFR